MDSNSNYLKPSLQLVHLWPDADQAALMEKADRWREEWRANNITVAEVLILLEALLRAVETEATADQYQAVRKEAAALFDCLTDAELEAIASHSWTSGPDPRR